MKLASYVLACALCLIVGGLVARLYFDDSETVERLKADVARLTDAAHDQAGRTSELVRSERQRMDSLAVVAESADTVFQATADTLRLAVPDSLRRHVNTLIAADSVKLEACEKRVTSCLTMLASVREERDRWRELAATSDTLISELDNPGPLEWLGDQVGLGAACGLTTDATLGCAVGVSISL